MKNDQRKILKPISHDPANNRLYVQDQDGYSYILVDHGKHCNTAFRIELYEMTDDGYPLRPLTKVSWELSNAQQYFPER